MSSPATIWNDEIDIGATFYREVIAYDDKARTQLTDLTNKLPRATLMDQSGKFIANFACAYLEATEALPKRIAWTMPRATTALLSVKKYIYSIDLDNGDNSDRIQKGSITAGIGQKYE